MDKLKAMEAFVKVVDTGGFTRAAEVMQMPKATVSTLIQDLESQLGVRLLHRTTRKVTVTATGRRTTSVVCASWTTCVKRMTPCRLAKVIRLGACGWMSSPAWPVTCWLQVCLISCPSTPRSGLRWVAVIGRSTW